MDYDLRELEKDMTGSLIKAVYAMIDEVKESWGEDYSEEKQAFIAREYSNKFLEILDN